jgi:hypothetical protein
LYRFELLGERRLNLKLYSPPAYSALGMTRAWDGLQLLVACKPGRVPAVDTQAVTQAGIRDGRGAGGLNIFGLQATMPPRVFNSRLQHNATAQLFQAMHAPQEISNCQNSTASLRPPPLSYVENSLNSAVIRLLLRPRSLPKSFSTNEVLETWRHALPSDLLHLFDCSFLLVGGVGHDDPSHVFSRALPVTLEAIVEH